ncbi:hypothetical protein Ahy_B02g060592 [Arachis hypogaea]|uniref:Aminotransferase-like plant mobile domain-containing protein n=1 Tax=Arachis hypogaea TaxID=3818 RepID=A0A445AIR9_ARAHY|nr:hypothetical protein Ahy_B02g060592 [Arachis hypogaea]
MIMHDRIVPYLDRANLLHDVRLNDYWFKLDEPLITSKDPYILHAIRMWYTSLASLLMDLQLVDVSGEKPAWVWFEELFGELPLDNCIDKFTVFFLFKVMPANALEATIQVYARGYIIILLSTTLFGDKSSTRVYLRWLSYVADLDGLGKVDNRNVKNLADGPLALV